MTKLNLCCGGDYKDGHINVDMTTIKSDGSPIKVDLILNLLDEGEGGLDYFPENSIDEIVFREALEHYNRWNGRVILRKIYKILKPGGILDLTVPPAAKQMKLLLMAMNKSNSEDFDTGHKRVGADKQVSYWKWHDDLMGGTRETDGKDGDSHKTFYTAEVLRTILKNLNFKIISIDENIHVKATK